MASNDNNSKGEDDFRTCPNCYYPLPRFGQYCSHCGQKYTDGKITVLELVRHFFSDTLNLDAKIWRTLLALFVPGKLTLAFFQGRQQRYLRPLRLFFIFAIVAIAAVSFFEAEFAEEFFLDIDDNFNSDIHYREFLEKLDSTSYNLKQELPPPSHPALDSLSKSMHQDFQDSIGIGIHIDWEEEEDFVTGFQVDKMDIANYSTDSLFQLYEVESFWEKLLLRQNLRLRQQGDKLGNYILNQTVWMMLLIMPILALLLKLLYIRRSFYYVEHLIFSFHIHAFAFLVLTVLMSLDSYPAIVDKMTTIWIIGILILQVYFYLALRRVYQQSFFKTFVKFCIFNILYFFIFLLALVITIFISALIY